MTVIVSKPAVNLREKLAELDKPAGIAGEAMLRAETPQEQFNLIGAGRRNLIINGAMQVWQRGTTFTNTGGAYNADRWYVDSNGNTGGRSTDAPDDFAYSLQVDPSTGNAAIRQAIELPAAGVGGIFRSGNSFTLSFYIKSENGGEAINIFVASSTLVSGSTTVHVNDTSTGLVTSTSWTRYTYTFACKDVGGSDTCFNVVPYVSSPDGDVYFTGVQLELGKVATPFEHRSYGEELALCQRYYYRVSTDSISGTMAVGFATSATGARGTIKFPVTMRVPPTGIEHTGSAANYKVAYAVTAATCSSVPTFANATNDMAGVQFTVASGLTAGHGIVIERNNGTAYIGFTGAEL